MTPLKSWSPFTHADWSWSTLICRPGHKHLPLQFTLSLFLNLVSQASDDCHLHGQFPLPIPAYFLLQRLRRNLLAPHLSPPVHLNLVFCGECEQFNHARASTLGALIIKFISLPFSTLMCSTKPQLSFIDAIDLDIPFYFLLIEHYCSLTFIALNWSLNMSVHHFCATFL